MKIFGFDISIKREQRTNLNVPLNAPTGWGERWDSIFADPTIITRRNALAIPAVYAAVDTVSRSLASLPFGLYQRTPTGSEAAKTHPLYNLLRLEPSPFVTAFNFRRDLFVDACFGNAFARIYRNGIGRPVKLERLDPEMTQHYCDENGKEYYITTNKQYGQTGNKYTILLREEVLHIRGIALDGYNGESITNLFASSLGTSYDATRYGYNFFKNNASVDKLVTFPNQLSLDSRKAIEAAIKRKHSGVSNAGSTMVLDNGAMIHKIGSTPADAALNDTRTFQGYETCRIFGVPAHMINLLDRSTFNNIEMMDNGFVKYCLVPWCEQLEQECDVKLLTQSEKATGNIFTRFNLSGLLRGDTKSRSEFYDTMLKNMVFTINDVRRLEGLNDVEWGYEPYAQSGMAQVDADGTVGAPINQAEQVTDQTQATT